jgi:hypothetical protein
MQRVFSCHLSKIIRQTTLFQQNAGTGFALQSPAPERIISSANTPFI